MQASVSFAWDVTEYLDAWKYVSVETRYDSKEFEAYGARWQLRCYPNGSKGNVGYIGLFLRCVKLPTSMNTNQVRIEYEMAIKGLQEDCSTTLTKTFKANKANGVSQLTERRAFYNAEQVVEIRCVIRPKSELLVLEQTKEIEALRGQIANFEHRLIAQEEELRKSSYVLHPVVSDEDTVYFVPSVDDEAKKNAQFEGYNAIFKLHTNTIEQWNVNTSKLEAITKQIKQKQHVYARNEENDMPLTYKASLSNGIYGSYAIKNEAHSSHSIGAELYAASVWSSGIINQQSKRLNNIGTDDHIKQLMKTQNAIFRKIKENRIKSASNAQQSEVAKKQYIEVQQKRLNLVKLIGETVKQCNETIDLENALLSKSKQADHSVSVINEEHDRLTSASKTCLSLINAYNEFEEDNNKHIELVKKYVEQKLQEFECKWWQWNVVDIISWFKLKTTGMDTSTMDWQHVENEMVKRNITGTSLEHFSDSRLDMIGIHNFNIAVHLMKRIATLRNKWKIVSSVDQDGNMSDDSKEDEGEIPSKFKCPITKQIMRDPVIAFDENVYEREAIVKYLRENGTSPVTGEEAYTLSVFANKSLKKEIQAYCSIHKIFGNTVSNEGRPSVSQSDTFFID